MFRRTSALLIGAAILTTVTGCRTSCGSGHGWFTSNSRGEPPCQLTGNAKMMEGCFDPAHRPADSLPAGGFDDSHSRRHHAARTLAPTR